MVNEVQVDVCDPELETTESKVMAFKLQHFSSNLFQAISDRSFNAQAIEPAVLGRDKYVAASEATFHDSFPCFLFVPIGLCGVCDARRAHENTVIGG